MSALLAATPRTTVFDRVVCGTDESALSLEAVRQAARLLGYGGSLELVTAVDASAASGLGASSGTVTALLEAQARIVLERTLAICGPARARIAYGAPEPVLLEAARAGEATLLVVGSHGRPRLKGILLGSVSTGLLHRAPCSVLVARPAREPDAFPRSIVVGANGSPHSLRAVAAARDVAERLRARLRTIVAGDPTERQLAAVRALVGRVEVDPREPLVALVEAADEADLLVVGSRALRGPRALASVSERLAHTAPVSVLVVRDASPAAFRETAGRMERDGTDG